MDPARALLKAALYHRRKVWRQICGVPRLAAVCDLCGQLNPSDLHENLVTRGDAQGNDVLQKIILETEVNLHLLCNLCNTRLARLPACRDWLTSLTVYRFGIAPLEQWLMGLPFAAGPGPHLHHLRAVQQAMAAISYDARWSQVLAVLRDHGPHAQPYSFQEVSLWQSRSSPAKP